MPTKKQLYQTWATEHEFPETRREDDPAYRKPKTPQDMPTESQLDITMESELEFNTPQTMNSNEKVKAVFGLPPDKLARIEEET